MVSYGIILIKRNVLDKSCREDENTHFKFSNFFQRIMPFMRCGKIW